LGRVGGQSALPSPVGEGVSRKADGWGVSPLGDSRPMAAGGSTHSNYPHLASPFGRGVLREQDGEGDIPRWGKGSTVRLTKYNDIKSSKEPFYGKIQS